MTSDVRVPVDAYLDAVDLALLRAGTSRGRRAGIVGDLETHILDALREGAGGREVVAEDVTRVLATLGSPEAYANGASPRVVLAYQSRRRLPVHVKWAMSLLVVGTVGVMILFSLLMRKRLPPSEVLLMMIATTPPILMMFLSSFLGVISWRAISREPGRFWGKPIAGVAILAFPILLLIASPVLFFAGATGGVLIFAVNRLYGLREVVKDMLASA